MEAVGVGVTAVVETLVEVAISVEATKGPSGFALTLSVWFPDARSYRQPSQRSVGFL